MDMTKGITIFFKLNNLSSKEIFQKFHSLRSRLCMVFYQKFQVNIEERFSPNYCLLMLMFLNLVTSFQKLVTTYLYSIQV